MLAGCGHERPSPSLTLASSLFVRAAGYVRRQPGSSAQGSGSRLFPAMTARMVGTAIRNIGNRRVSGYADDRVLLAARPLSGTRQPRPFGSPAARRFRSLRAQNELNLKGLELGTGQMQIQRQWRAVLWLLTAAALVVPASAQQPPASEPAAPATPAPAKKPPKHKPAEPARAAAGGTKPTLLGQYGDWGAYTASPGGKKVCFAIAKPSSSETNPPNRPRNPAYMFITSRPTDKVVDEFSIVIGYPFKSGSEASVDVGSTSFALYTQEDGAWIKNATEETNLINAMRDGDRAVVKGISSRSTHSTDTYSLKGLSQALDRTGQDCK